MHLELTEVYARSSLGRQMAQLGEQKRQINRVGIPLGHALPPMQPISSLSPSLPLYESGYGRTRFGLTHSESAPQRLRHQRPPSPPPLPYKIPRPPVEEPAERTFYRGRPQSLTALHSRPLTSSVSFHGGQPRPTGHPLTLSAGLAGTRPEQEDVARPHTSSQFLHRERSDSPEYIDAWKGHWKDRKLFSDKNWMLFPRSRARDSAIADVPFKVGLMG